MNTSTFASLTVALIIALQGTSAYAMPPTKTIAPGAHRVHMLAYETSSTCESLSLIRKMTLIYDTSVDAVGIRTVYASVNGKRIGARKTINVQDRTINLSFPRAADVEVCSGKTIDIFADFSRTVEKGSTHHLYVELEGDIITDEGFGGIPQVGDSVTVR